MRETFRMTSSPLRCRESGGRGSIGSVAGGSLAAGRGDGDEPVGDGVPGAGRGRVCASVVYAEGGGRPVRARDAGVRGRTDGAWTVGRRCARRVFDAERGADGGAEGATNPAGLS